MWCSYSEVRLMTFLSNSQDILMRGPLPLTLMMLDKPCVFITICNMSMSGWYNLLRLSRWWSENYLVFRWVHHQYYNVWAQCEEYQTHITYDWVGNYWSSPLMTVILSMIANSATPFNWAMISPRHPQHATECTHHSPLPLHDNMQLSITL